MMGVMMLLFMESKMSVTKAIIRLVFDLELSAIVILWMNGREGA